MTDGKTIYYNPRWISGLEFNRAVGLVAHEVLHCVLQHLTRMGYRKPGKWNQATDYVVNRILADDRLEMPEGGLLSKKYTGDWSAERIYDDLPDNPVGEQMMQLLMNALAGNGDASGLSPDSGGLFAPSTHTSEAERSELEQEWRIAATQAARVAKSQGKLPGGLEELFKDLLAPKIDWKEVLRRFVQQSTFHDDYTWRRPNRRLVSQGLYFPSMLGESTGKLVVGVDTSGSISSNELHQFLSEVNAILEETSPERLYVVYCDAAVQRVDEYTREEAPIVARAVGRGGTDFRPVFEEVEKRDIQPAALIYLTDMYGGFPKERPPYPTLWISNSQVDSAPFGEVVRMHN
jgi:predicted metal-dependent peptidase